MRGRLYPVGGDWCEWRQDPPLPVAVLVQIRSGPGGRLVLSGLRIDGEPTAELLRAIPIGRIEAAANAQLAIVDDAVPADVPEAPRREPGPVVPRHGPGPEPISAAAGAPPPTIVSTGWEISDPGRAVPRRTAYRIRSRTPVDGARRPDAFYADVARSYLDLAQTSARPALELATANDIPVSTAHRWIKEARRRGFLPPGRPGKAG